MFDFSSQRRDSGNVSSTVAFEILHIGKQKGALAMARVRFRPQHFSGLHRRCLTGPSTHNSYDDTVKNLRIGKHTRVIYQGFTGRVATANAKDSIEYGTNVVGGVSPGRQGEHLGVPLLPDIKSAKDQLKPDATAIFVAAPRCGQAIEDAIEEEIPLIVAVAEHVPLHDMLRVRWLAGLDPVGDDG